MSGEPIFLTDDEAAALREAVGRIVAGGLRVPVSEQQLPDAGRMDGYSGKALDIGGNGVLSASAEGIRGDAGRELDGSGFQ